MPSGKGSPAFTQACARVLRPGGVLMGLTVNMWHYFGLATWAATRAGVADRLLPHLRPRTLVDHYHFATEYRINSTANGMPARKAPPT